MLVERLGQERIGLGDLLSHCVSIDLEVDPATGRIFKFAAVKGASGQTFSFKGGALHPALRDLDEFVRNTSYVLGHNIIFFDFAHLAAAKADLQLLRLPVIDTLWLNPLAFPRNPYHSLVKHYQDGRLQGGHVNDPVLDARLAVTVLESQLDALANLNGSNPDLCSAFHWLASTREEGAGFDALFSAIRGQPRPDQQAARHAIQIALDGNACSLQIDRLLAQPDQHGWSLAYALAWISVAGADSVMPPWVRHQFPAASQLVKRLRDTPCRESTCSWCSSQNNPQTLLKQWFGFDEFRPEPKGMDGRSLQETIVSTAMGGKNVLGILPTGTGKSVCYQLPALARYHKTGTLTVVISPLVALMADQVDSLHRAGILSCVAVNGMLSLPERHSALDQVRLGDAAILLISPEQLRSRSIRAVLRQREIGYWVLDEAHCLSKWGHDFRPDYRYIARFIKELARDEAPPPILCLTATAKPDVISDITDHFRTRLGIDLTIIDGGAVRRNLEFQVVPTNAARKPGDIAATIEQGLPRDGASGAIVYCATRHATEQVAEFLRLKGYSAAHFHAGLKPETKREVQERFRTGDLRVIAATNAFGMGIDKPDIRLVVHSDIPGSLENYIQEAGRAGRDRHRARCILLYDTEDVERQFKLSARSRLAQREIASILTALRRLDHMTRRGGEVVATTGEIAKEELDQEFVRDSATDDTRVKTAIAWLEEAALLLREENRVRIFPSSLRIRTAKEAEAILAAAAIAGGYRRKLIQLVHRLVVADPVEGISTDELAGASGLSGPGLRKALHDLERLGIASNDTAITVFLHIGVKNSSAQRLQDATVLERDLVERLQTFAPDLDTGEGSQLNLRIAAQELRDAGHSTVRPDMIERIMRGLSRDGRNEGEGIGSLSARKLDRDRLWIRLQRTWPKLARTAELRRTGASALVRFLEDRAPRNARGNDIQVETTLGALMGALANDLEIGKDVQDLSRFLDRCLLWLHEQRVITLGKGLTIFRPAMTIYLAPGTKKFTKADFEPLALHYDEQVLQVHIMAEYARRGLEAMSGALRLVEDYFVLDREAFLKRWLASRGSELQRQTTADSWRAIVEALDNPNQARIVADDREQTNVLVLAGPGSGKTRVLVHRIAYLIRVRRENPKGILALVYNRHAATEIRTRLYALIGEDARHVTVSTCHGLAMRLVGASFAKRSDRFDAQAFDQVLRDAVTLLVGQDLTREEAEAQRETLLEGYRWILVDEYQDIGPEEYELISAVVGRSLEDDSGRLSLFAVGDDDQNIYAFSGASVAFIRRFEQDYAARPVYLVENYRSTAHIIQAANRLISLSAERMKVGHDIVPNRARKREPEGGQLQKLDPVGRGRVQILPKGRNDWTQAIAAMKELERLSKIVPDWDWAKAAVIAREWKCLHPVRSYCEAHGISVQVANEEAPPIWRLRETQRLVNWLEDQRGAVISPHAISTWLAAQPDGPWWALLQDAVANFVDESGDRETYAREFIEWLAEWGQDARKRQIGLLLLTAHRAKGLEFEDVVVLDGGWDRTSPNDDADAARRLYYVAMTRAKRSLALVRSPMTQLLLDDPSGQSALLRTSDADIKDVSDCQKVYQRLKLSDVDLSYAGRLHPMNAALPAIAALNVGDSVYLKRANDSWVIANAKGLVVGRLARKYTPPPGMAFKSGTVAAIVVRREEDSSEEFHAHLMRKRWEVVIPELVFSPN